MKSPESKSSTPAALQHTTESNPFFSKARSGVFDPDNHSKEPFFSGIHPVQAKLKIHPADDAYEKEADAVADQVVKQVTAPPLVHRKETQEENVQALPLTNTISSLQTQRAFESPTALEQSNAQTEDNFGLQTKAGEAVSTHSRGLESQLQAARGSGSQLPESTRSRMESGFGSDFSGVRVHTGSDAVQMNRDVGARAFTHGNDIYFNSGEYNPSSPGGDHLLAHELTHTVQQGAVKPGGSSVQQKNIGNANQFTGRSVVPDPVQKPSWKGNELLKSSFQSGPAPSDAGNGSENIKYASIQRKFYPLSGLSKGISKHSDFHTGFPVQRKGGINDVIAKNFEHSTLGKINTDAKEITIPEIMVPPFKVAVTGKTNRIVLPKLERSNKQRDIWDNKVKSDFNETLLTTKISSSGSPGITTPGGQKTYAFKAHHQSGSGLNSYVVGDLSTIKDRVGRPGWDKNGNQAIYHVDHQHEFQLGGPDLLLSNMWLLEATANTSSGADIKIQKDKRITDLVAEASKPGPKQVWDKAPKAETVKNQYQVEFLKAVTGLPEKGKPGISYTMDDIINGESLKGLDVLSSTEIDNLGFSRDDILNVFTRKDGGKVYKIDNWETTKGEQDIHLGLGANLEITKVSFNKDSGGSVKGRLLDKSPNASKYLKKSAFSFPIKPLAGFPNTAYLDQSSMRAELKEKLVANGLSPIDVMDADIEQQGLVVRGKIMPSIPVIEKAGIDLVLDGDNIYLEKVFNTGEFKVPAPFKITDSSLAIRAGTNGIEFAGGVDFGIDRVGEGSMKAHVNSKQEFGVTGSFEFDKKLFDNAKVEVSYENRQWAVKGTIEIPKGKVKGIKKANATIAYSEGTLSASGTVEPEIKGVKQGSFELKYSQDQFMMSGQLQLSPEIPRLKKGEINVTLESKPDSGYKLKGSGIAEFDFPGINTGLNVQYDDGLLTVEATVNFEKGIAKGEVKAGATNRPVDAQGNPVGEPGDKWTIYGGGTLTVKITPWLQVTAGVHFLPNGELEVLGRIELPSTVDVFSQKSFEKTLFSMPTIEIPLFAIPLGPKSLGLVAQIRGGLDFKASIGPGQLRGLFGQIKYNPSRPEETTLTGGGSFVIPAEAGLNLHASLGLGLSVGIASLTGGIELVAGVGLKGEASAGLNLSWNPTTGLELNAEGRVTVQPKFKFDVNLFARASLDLFLFEISKEWRYNLASFEWGPGFEFGLVFPIHYKEGQPFNISFDDIQVIKPDVDILGTAKGLANKVKDEVF